MNNTNNQTRIPALSERGTFTVAQLAQSLNLSTRSIYRLVKRDLLRPSRAVRKLIFTRWEVERFLEETSATITSSVI
ncbi:MAG: helix-turn-helix domain-containing protein [Verrucomicrobia bacterium]|nr:helix-turn-helix domain-containing protein [Verrucomicrobiota bacterium]